MKKHSVHGTGSLWAAGRLVTAVAAGAVFSWLVFSWMAAAEAGPWPPTQPREEEPAHGESPAEEHGDDHGHEAESNMDWFLGKDHLISHTQDQLYFEMPSLKANAEDPGKKWYIPQPFKWTKEHPLVKQPEGKAGEFVGPVTFQITKYVVLQLLAGLLVCGPFIWLGKKIQTGQPPTGKLWNMLEAVVMFLRDDVCKAAIGSADYKRFLPLIWTVFFFVLTMNLMGMFPLLGTPTGNISVTSALALSIFGVVLFSGMKRLGVVGFWKAQAPHMDLPGAMKIPMTVGIWAIEVFGLFIKHLVLAVRLFANMFSGHMVLAVLVGFIGAFWGTTLGWVVTPAAIGGSVALNLLELLVAFIQAYVFAFLSALFIGAAIHPH
jgi:F-type H+-transporting ATPase subunit a